MSFKKGEDMDPITKNHKIGKIDKIGKYEKIKIHD